MTRESVAEDIANAITTWETYDWKDTDLWESFQDDFEGYTEEDFKLVSNNDIQKLRNFLMCQTSMNKTGGKILMIKYPSPRSSTPLW